MKSFNSYLLTHHPLLWNLRLHWMLPVIIVLHLLFFSAGFVPVSFPASLNYYTLRPQEGIVSMAVLSALLLGILWLVFYFRNNAFKSFYPLAKGRLAAEAGLVFLTCLGLTTFTASYQAGRYSHIRIISNDIDLKREADVANLAHHFLPFYKGDFSQRSDCAYRNTTKEPWATSVDSFSYLHYCSNAIPDYSIGKMRSSQANDTIAKRWLLSGRRDSVRRVLTEFLKLTKKYGGDYKFDADAQVAEIFAEPGFPVKYELKRNAYYSNTYNGSTVEAAENTEPATYDDSAVAAQRARDPRYIEESKVSGALSTIGEARDGWLDTGMIIFFFYFSLGIALLIFSFRITAVRTWFITLIGAGIWMAIFGVLGAVFRAGDGLMIIFLLLTIVFLAVAISFIGKQKEKGKAGVLYLWSLWAMPAFLPLLIAYIDQKTRPHGSIYDPSTKTYITRPTPVHDWISAHWDLVGFSNMLLFVLLLLLLFIPLARRWQAMPEE